MDSLRGIHFDSLGSYTNENEFTVLDKITNIFKDILSIDEVLAKGLTKNIIHLQEILKEGELTIIEASENIPFEIIVTKDITFCLFNKLGQGSYSNVYGSKAVANSRMNFGSITLSLSKPQQFALKKSRQKGATYSPEKRTIDQAASPRKTGIDYSLGTFKEKGGFAISVHQEMSKSFSKTKFSALPNPALTIANVLISVTEALGKLHANGHIHRDIKGANLMLKITENERIAVITDFGFLMKQVRVKHKTTGTPEYLDPQMFGDVETTLIKQCLRKGIQTQQGDVYALGITITKDILIPLIQDLVPLTAYHMEISNYLKTISTTEMIGRYCEENLKIIALNHPFRCMYRHLPNGMAKIVIYPPLDTLRSLLKECLRLLKGTLTDIEISGLLDIADIGCEMQEHNLDKRLGTHDVISQLEKVIEGLSTNNKKRKSSVMTESNELLNDGVRNTKRRIDFSEDSQKTLLMTLPHESEEDVKEENIITDI